MSRLQFYKKFGYLRGYLLSRKLYPTSRVKQRVKLRLPGIKTPLVLRTNTSDIGTFTKIFMDGEYDFYTNLDARFIIDAGANIGLASLAFAARFPSASIIAIEPEAENVSLLRYNLTSCNCKIVQGAIWNKKASLTIKDIHANTSGFEIVESEDGSLNSCPAYTLDELSEGHQAIDILKIDIEGSELEIFSAGFENWLPRTKILIIETHDRFRPGSSEAVEAAINKYSFRRFSKGENIFYVNVAYNIAFSV